DPILVPAEDGQLPTAVGVPQAHRGVERTGGQAAPVRREGHGSHGALVATEASQLAAAVRVPQADYRVAPGSEASAVRRKRHARHPTLMRLNAGDLPAAVGVPET